MNPFKISTATLSSGFYFDFKNKCICYLHIELDSATESEQIIYNRFSTNEKSNFGIPEEMLPDHILSKRKKYSLLEDLMHLSLLDSYKIEKELDQDFCWICNNDAAKNEFIEYLNKEELYNLLYLFHSYVVQQSKSKEEIYNEMLQQEGHLFIRKTSL